jgi:hypothetical protein
MPIIIPVQDNSSLIPEVLGNFAGNTDLTGSLTVKFGLRGNLVGSTAVHGELGALYGALAGATALSGSLRINAEANVFLAGVLDGSTTVMLDLSLAQDGGGTFAGATALSGEMTVVSEDEPQFTVSVDILDSAIYGQGNIRRYSARVLADGVGVPIKSASLESAPDTLGTEVRFVLAVPDAGLVTIAQSIDFQIGLWTGMAFSWVTLVSGGRLSSRQNTLRNQQGMPDDEVSLSIVDVVADRWNRAPRAPVHLYDPQRSPAPDPGEIQANRIEVLGGGFISQVNTPVSGMRLRDVLARAYVDGCGFSSVVTNIPNFPVEQADFSLDGGYDAGVRPLIGIFSPVLFERENVLYVIDPDAPLPAGMTPRDLTHAQTRELADSLPQREPVNALLVRMRQADGGEYTTERVETEDTTQGVFGQPSYTETDTERRIKEWRNFSQPTVILREEVESETTRVLDYQFNLIEETVETVQFDTFNRKTGSSKRTSMLIPDPAADGAMTFTADVTRQEQQITYRTDPQDPSKDLQDRVTTVTSGLVLVDDDNQYLDASYRIPVLDAHRSGYIDPNGSQHLEQQDIRTTIEQLRVRGEQVDVEVRVIDHVSNVPTRNTTTTRPATADVSRKEQSRQRTILLTTPGTDTVSKRAQTLDAGDLPYDVALALGKRKLLRLNNPPREVTASPAYVDVTIRRGTVVQLKKRGGSALGNYIVRGVTVEFAAYGQGEGIRAAMSLQAREIQ